MRKTARAIIVENGYLYVVKRITKKWGTYYSIPGGGIEEGETPEMAVIREVKEELNLDVEIIKPFNEYNDIETNRYHYLFLCKIVGGTLGKGSGEEYLFDEEDNQHIPYKIELGLALKETFMPRVCEKDLFDYIEKEQI